MNPLDQPIGYWLRHLHNLIEAGFEATLAQDGLGRRHWQTLHMLDRAPHDPDELHRALAPFGEDVSSTLDDLVARGWVTAPDGAPVALTPAGRAAHTRIAGQLGAARERLMSGLSTDQYAETIRVLAAMAANLEATAPGADGSPR